MKRLLIILVALGLLVASAAPAGAKKPTPDLVEVTLSGDLDTAACEGPILMEESRQGVLSAGQEAGPPFPRIWINAPLGWDRNFPAPTSGEDFSGCHGGPVSGSLLVWGGLLRITPTDDSVEILWIFDHYFEERFPKPNAKKKELIVENFRLDGEALLDEQSGDYTGEFTVSYFLRDDSNREHIGYELGTATLSFQLSISDPPTAP